MKEVINKNECCGCHACYNICPKNVIRMIEDEKGFKYPVINQDKCINCGLCKKVCAILNKKNEIKKKIEAYACYNKKDSEILSSSSGGIFILLAREIIKRKGVVFGACFDKEFSVIHTYVENEKDLKMFMGSKYTQSTIGDTYKKVKQFLESDRYVLFTGTPCQIEGLLSYLGKEYDKLYTQDIICHGVPSPKAWKKYLDYQKNVNNDDIKKISFRDKKYGWLRYQVRIDFNKKTYNVNHDNDLYMKSFLSNICLRDSCYNCSFKKKYRISDITLADYWGINKQHPEFFNDKGVSLVIINSDKGRELFELISKKITYIETEFDDAIKYNPAMILSVNHCKNEREFINNIDNLSFDKLVNKYVPKVPVYKKVIIRIKRIIKFVLRIK